jgi:hypothetical protein
MWCAPLVGSTNFDVGSSRKVREYKNGAMITKRCQPVAVLLAASQGDIERGVRLAAENGWQVAASSTAVHTAGDPPVNVTPWCSMRRRISGPSTLRCAAERKGPLTCYYLVVGQDLNLRLSGYEDAGRRRRWYALDRVSPAQGWCRA